MFETLSLTVDEDLDGLSKGINYPEVEEEAM